MAELTATARVGVGGTATITVKPASRQTWSVTQVSIEMPTAPGGATCSVRKNGRLVSPLVAQADTAAGDPPVPLLPSDSMTIEWIGCTSGDVGSALVFYDEVTG